MPQQALGLSTLRSQYLLEVLLQATKAGAESVAVRELLQALAGGRIPRERGDDARAALRGLDEMHKHIRKIQRSIEVQIPLCAIVQGAVRRSTAVFQSPMLMDAAPRQRRISAAYRLSGYSCR